jgi:hypothetical protein
MAILIDMPISASHGLKMLSFQEHCKINYPLYSLENTWGFDQDK